MGKEERQKRCRRHRWHFLWVHDPEKKMKVVGYKATCRRCGATMEHYGDDMKYRLKW